MKIGGPHSELKKQKIEQSTYGPRSDRIQIVKMTSEIIDVRAKRQ